MGGIAPYNLTCFGTYRFLSFQATQVSPGPPNTEWYLIYLASLHVTIKERKTTLHT